MARIGCRQAVLVDDPAVRNLAAVLARLHHLERRHIAHSDIQKNRGGALCRSGIGQRIVAKQHPLCAGRGHIRVHIADAKPQHPGFGGHIGVKSGRAEVVAAANGHERHAGFARLFNGKLHGPVGGAFTHAVLSVQKRIGRAVGQDLEGRVDIHPAGAEFFDIVMQVFRPVGVRPIFVRLGKRLGAAARVAAFHALMLQRGRAERL